MHVRTVSGVGLLCNLLVLRNKALSCSVRLSIRPVLRNGGNGVGGGGGGGGGARGVCLAQNFVR